MKNIKRLLLLSVLILGMFNLVGFAYAEEGSELTAVDVEGIGVINAKPDVVSVRMDVVTEGKDKNIMEANALKTRKVIEALKAAGLDTKEIETDSVNFYPITRWNKDSEKQENIGYRASNNILVTTNKLDKIGNIIDLSIKNGAERINSLNFTLSNEGQSLLMNEAIVKAVNDAKKQANAISKALGSRIIKVKNIEVQKNFNTYPVYFRANSLKVEAADSTPIAPKELEYKVLVNMTYLIK